MIRVITLSTCVCMISLKENLIGIAKKKNDFNFKSVTKDCFLLGQYWNVQKVKKRKSIRNFYKKLNYN